jgi:hypothetical protein
MHDRADAGRAWDVADRANGGTTHPPRASPPPTRRNVRRGIGSASDGLRGCNMARQPWVNGATGHMLPGASRIPATAAKGSNDRARSGEQ